MARPRTDLSKGRYQVMREGDKYAVIDLETGLCFGRSVNETKAISKAKHLNTALLLRQDSIPKPEPVANLRKLPSFRFASRNDKNEPHGKCWSKFGTINTDSASPVRASIRNWGLKIKAREEETWDGWLAKVIIAIVLLG